MQQNAWPGGPAVQLSPRPPRQQKGALKELLNVRDVFSAARLWSPLPGISATHPNCFKKSEGIPTQQKEAVLLLRRLSRGPTVRIESPRTKDCMEAANEGLYGGCQ